MLARFWTLATLGALAAGPLQAQSDSPRTDSTRASDSLSSGGTFRGSFLRRLPIDDPRQAFTLIPGVVLRVGDIGAATAPDLSFRGSVPGRAAVYIDGAPVRFQTIGGQGVGLADNAIEEAWLTTGIAPAALADVSGGVISYVTRTGGDRLSGRVRWDSDEPFGNGVSVGYNRVEGSAGGPLPIGRNVSFFVSATLQGQLSGYRGPGAASTPTYVPFGIDTVVEFASGATTPSVSIPRFVQWSGACDASGNANVECQGLRRPMDWSTSRRIQGKVRHAYGAAGASSVSLTLLGSDLQQRSYPGQQLMDAALYAGARARSLIGIVNWRHELGAWRGGALALDVNLSLGSDDQISGALSAASEAATREPYLGIEFETLQFTGSDLIPLPVTDQLVRNIRTNTGQRVPYPNRVDLANQQPYRLNPYGVGTAWPSAGANGLLNYVSERRLRGQWALDWRPGTDHRLTLGADAERIKLSKYQSSLITQAFFDAFVERPSRVGAFANDRLALGRAVLEVGVRYDRIAAGGEFATTPGRIYTNPAWLFGADTNDVQYATSVANTFRAVTSRGAWSPRVRFAYVVSPSTNVRVGFGRSFEPPSWGTFFQNANADLDYTNTSAVFGRDVKFATPWQLDLGVRSAVGRDVILDLAVYRKDLPQYQARLKPFADPLNAGDTTDFNVVTPVFDAHGVGLDAHLDWRVGAWLTASAAYSMLRTHTGPLADDVTNHAVAAVATVEAPRDLRAQVMLRATSGIAYNAQPNFGFGTITPFSPLAIPSGSQRLPWTKRIDVRVTKPVRAGGRAWTVYADVRNLFNWRNTRSVFNETGAVTNPQHRLVASANESGPLNAEASANGALEPDGSTINLTGCGAWSVPVDCVILTRVERRFGDGNGLYTLPEQQRAFNAYYDAFDATWFFFGSGRTLRVGVELEL